MGEIFKMFGVFACTLDLLFLYLLARSTIEKSVNSISLVKILGYSDGEIGKLYNYATGSCCNILAGDFSVLRRANH